LARGDVEQVRRAFEAYSGRDLELLLTLVDPDVEVRSLMTESERTFYRGHDGVREWFAAVFEIFPDWEPKARRIHDFGGNLVVEFDVTATAAASGVRIEQTFWQAVRVAGGKITWFGFFRSEADALAALSP
jgi:ketosteroid isomerase-like protein